MEAANEKQWRNLWLRIGAHGDPARPWQLLHAAYTKSWRAYHNLNHIEHCLKEFAGVSQLADDAKAIEAAIWFHDVIYDTHGKDNEERSADVAESVLSAAGLTEEFRSRVHALILATRHTESPIGKDASLLVDIDLSILGSSVERYDEFERQIRAEYSWVTESDFATGRANVLKGFLSRGSIFTSETFSLKHEVQARSNLARAIKRLVG